MMQIIESRAELQDWSDGERAAGQRIALVPTMGALHRGHLSLVAEARRRADRVVVSVFVNPTQFNDPKDFDGYPRVLEADLAACRAAGVDVVWTPQSAELYPAGAASWVDVEGLSEPLCGGNRPGHFRGVTTVVTKLFLAARPHVALFGEKDYQQLAVIRRMATDLGFGIEIIGGKTVREPDGLALSSRNVHLGPRARQQASSIVASLEEAETLLAEGERNTAPILEAVKKKLEEATLASVDYAELRDPGSLELAGERIEGPTLLAIALQFEPDSNAAPDAQGGRVRLIDNRVLLPRLAAAAGRDAASQSQSHPREQPVGLPGEPRS
jgi:pantoate--beta-alanine ligase